jgi:hypothetical protein
MPEQSNPTEPALTCPSQRDGLYLFGCHFDPIEIVLHFLVMVILGVPAVRASTTDRYSPSEGLAWIVAIVGSSTFVRLSPTDRIDAYLKLKGLPGGTNESL